MVQRWQMRHLRTKKLKQDVYYLLCKLSKSGIYHLCPRFTLSFLQICDIFVSSKLVRIFFPSSDRKSHTHQ